VFACSWIVSVSAEKQEDSTHRLVQYACHAIDEKLKVLWPVQSAEEVAEEVLRRWSVARLWYGV
jgi:hypothetical protein